MQCTVVVCDEQAVVSAVAVPAGSDSVRVDVAYCEQHWPEYQAKFKSFESIDLVDVALINTNRKPWMNDRIAEIDARWQWATPGPWKTAEQTHGEWVGIHDNFRALGSMVKPEDADAVAHAREDVAYLLDGIRHMTESWQTAEEAFKALDRVEKIAQAIECDPTARSGQIIGHRPLCPGCSRADQIRAAIRGDE